MKKNKLTPLQYHVTQENGTEPPFQNEFWNHHEAGLYVDIISGEALFTSDDKFDSGCGWPSFSQSVDDDKNIMTQQDESYSMIRTEVRSRRGNSHLGHLFNDGPPEKGGLRYCINSASLRFIPIADLETIILSGGCFWGLEELLSNLPGVVNTTAGYAGGVAINPCYEEIKTGTTGHAESVKIIFEAKKLTLENLFIYFFKIHDPTTINRQGYDMGSQYRSQIICFSEEQYQIAERIKKKVNDSQNWKNEVVTQIIQVDKRIDNKNFYPAEKYHQHYLKKNPGGYSCHYLRNINF